MSFFTLKHILLTADEEKALARRWRDDGDKKALDALVKSNMRLAKKYAGSWRNSSLDMDELEQLATIGVWEAAKRFDPDKGFRFSTYAQHWMHAEITNHLKDNASDVRLPRAVRDKQKAVEASYDRLRERGHCGTADEISAELEERGIYVTTKTALGIIEAMKRPLSMNDYYASNESGKGDLLQDRLPAVQYDAWEEIDTKVRHERFAEAVTYLSERNRDIIVHRVVNGYTLEETGEMVGGISRERVRQLQGSILPALEYAVETGDMSNLSEIKEASRFENTEEAT